MKTILVPTDFSPTAKNAAIYAIRIATDLEAEKIVLFNAYQPVAPIVNEPTMPTTSLPVVDLRTMEEISTEGLNSFKQELSAQTPANIQIELRSELASLADNIDDICNATGAELIVMGVTETSKIEELLIGSTATSVVKNTKVPVIIVPPGATYSKIEDVVFACDFKKVAETTPVDAIKGILTATKARLHVLNVQEHEKENTNKKDQQQILQSLLIDYNPVFHSIYNPDFITAVNDFADANSIDLIITIPKKHQLFDGLFRESHSKKLAFHSHVPLMCIHQEDL